MSKRLGVSPKSVEKPVSVQAEAHEMLWRAVPRERGENLKAWFPRAARVLGWSERRVRSFWNKEQRRVDYAEIETLNKRIAALKADEVRHERIAHEIRTSLEGRGERMPLDRGAPQVADDAVAGARRVVPGPGDQ